MIRNVFASRQKECADENILRINKKFNVYFREIDRRRKLHRILKRLWLAAIAAAGLIAAYA
ncbi:MAG: hypothetical protein K8F57_01490, partial [Alphaproteobacteria bacterium]|nr:hypothetical protein [Alphaproteobacteria bacterium]